MIRWVAIVGAQCNGTHAQHGQRGVRHNVNIMVQWSITTQLFQAGESSQLFEY